MILYTGLQSRWMTLRRTDTCPVPHTQSSILSTCGQSGEVASRQLTCMSQLDISTWKPDDGGSVWLTDARVLRVPQRPTSMRRSGDSLVQYRSRRRRRRWTNGQRRWKPGASFNISSRLCLAVRLISLILSVCAAWSSWPRAKKASTTAAAT